MKCHPLFAEFWTHRHQPRRFDDGSHCRPPATGWPRLALVTAVLLSCFTLPIHAHASDLTGELGLSSQLAERGMAITRSTPAMQGAIAWNSPTGWSLGLSAGTTLRSPGHLAVGVARLSHYWTLSGDWQMQSSLLYYHYSGISRLNAYEASVGWIYKDVLTFGVSGIYALGSKKDRLRPAADLDFRWPLAHGFSVSAGMGISRYVIPVYLNHEKYSYSAIYTYRDIGLQWTHGGWRVQLDRMMLGRGARRRLSYLAASPWVATVSWSF